MITRLPPCGVYCKNCVAYNEKRCAGCIETKGKPGHPHFIESRKSICPVFECAAKQKVEHCGLCREFPCDTFMNWYNPKRGIVGVLRRVGLLTLRKKLGNDAWIEWMEEKKIDFGS